MKTGGKSHMKKKTAAWILCALLLICALPFSVLAETATDAPSGDRRVTLGADLTLEQRDQIYKDFSLTPGEVRELTVTNKEERTYLEGLVSERKIGSRALSCSFITILPEGSGLDVTLHNINYCTAGMYKNALATAGVEDANVIVAGPFPLSGTAALVGTFEAYEKLTGKELDESVVDAAMDELVTTGDLEKSIDGDSNDVEAMIADLKGQIASGKIKTPEEIEQAIEKLADKYDLKLSDDDKQKLLGLMKKLQGLDLNWDSIKNQASAWASQLQNQLADKNIGQKIAAFFEKLFDMIRSLFQK